MEAAADQGDDYGVSSSAVGIDQAAAVATAAVYVEPRRSASVVQGHCRTYAEVQRLCLASLRDPKSINCATVLSILSVLPQPKNTRRIGVIPAGQEFVYSQAAGLTTQRNVRPALSSISSKCPLLLQVLSKFVLNYDPGFTFTTITINYNYAAAAHRDVNHVDGKARIIALGEFTGGELQIESLGAVDIKDLWFDFDGRLLHETLPFTRERYSLVYFTHVASLQDNAGPVMTSLMNLGIPCAADAGGNAGLVRDKNPSVSVLSHYLLLANTKAKTYSGAFYFEAAALADLHPEISICGENQSSEGPIIISSERDEIIMQHITSRSVTFSTWKVLFEANSIDELQEYDIEASDLVPVEFISTIEIPSGTRQKYSGSTLINVDVTNFGSHKLTATQKRKLLVGANVWSKVDHCCNEETGSNDLSDNQGAVTTRYQRNFNIVMCPVTNRHTSEASAMYYLCEQIGVTMPKAKKKLSKCMSNGAQLNDEDSTVLSPSSVAATPLKAEHCCLLCNLARLEKHSLVYDPFCGSCSILVVVQTEFGCITLGSDANVSASEANVEFFASHCFIGNIYHRNVGSANSSSSVTQGLKLDAIVCDPPYGRRERHIDKSNSDYARHATPEERALYQFKVLAPLFQLASDILRVGGRLVFLFMK
jgi:hypothetical protein